MTTFWPNTILKLYIYQKKEGLRIVNLDNMLRRSILTSIEIFPPRITLFCDCSILPGTVIQVLTPRFCEGFSLIAHLNAQSYMIRDLFFYPQSALNL